MCRRETKSTAVLAAAAAAGIVLGAALGGCSDTYSARRDTITLGVGDDIAANNALQTADPWPPHSGNPNIGFDGQRMQSAIERYRQDKVSDAADPQAPVITSQSQNVTQVSVGGASPSSLGAAAASGVSSAATATPGQ